MPKQTEAYEEFNIVINQENDIVQLLEGFINILKHCLGTMQSEDSIEQ